MTQERHSELAIHPAQADDGHDLLQRQQVARRTRIAGIVVLVLLALGAARTVVSRMQNAHALEARVQESAVQYVKTALVKSGGAVGQTLQLPGTLQGCLLYTSDAADE